MPNDKRERLKELIREGKKIANWHRYDLCETIADHLLKNDTEFVIRCKDCDLSIDEGCREDICWCRVHAAFLTKDFYCKYGTPRENC